MSIGMGELLLILVIAFVVVGPKDLPKIARALARGILRVKRFAREITGSLELDDVKREVRESMREADITGEVDRDATRIRQEIAQIYSEKL